MLDIYGRDINYLRISLTDRCNLRCIYCLPEKAIFKGKDRLSKDDVLKISEAGKRIGINKIRLTGGEPLLREDIVEIVEGIKKIGIDRIYITTNGILLEEKIRDLKKVGLSGVNISLDTTDSELFKKITRGGNLDKVINGIDTSLSLGLSVKINSVILKGINDVSIKSLAGLTFDRNIDVRFIELMPIGEGKKYDGIKNSEIYEYLKKEYGFLDEKKTEGVSEYFTLVSGKGRIGFISPLNNCFCETCNKIRVTSDGTLKRCLNMEGTLNLKDMSIEEKNIDEIEEILKYEIYRKPEKHLFGQKNENEEKKNMNEIGG